MYLVLHGFMSFVEWKLITHNIAEYACMYNNSIQILALALRVKR